MGEATDLLETAEAGWACRPPGGSASSVCSLRSRPSPTGARVGPRERVARGLSGFREPQAREASSQGLWGHAGLRPGQERLRVKRSALAMEDAAGPERARAPGGQGKGPGVALPALNPRST